MPFISPIDGSVQPDTWTEPRYSLVKNPFFDYNFWSAYINQGETRNPLLLDYPWAEPGASLYGIPTVSFDGRITWSRSWSENPNDTRPLVPFWYGNETGNYVDANSAPEWIVKPNPAYLRWGAHRFALYHPDEYAAAMSDSGAFGQLRDFLGSDLLKPLYIAGAAYLAGSLSVDNAIDVFGEGTPGATVDWGAADAIETTTVSMTDPGATNMDFLDWYNDREATVDPFATTDSVNAGWTYENGYGVDWYNSAGIGEATASNSLDSILGAVNKVAGTVRNVVGTVAGSIGAVQRTATAAPPPNLQRAAGSMNIGLLAVAALAWKLL